MATNIIIVLLIILVFLLIKITNDNTVIKQYRKNTIILGSRLNKTVQDLNRLEENASKLESERNSLYTTKHNLENYLKTFINERIKVYINSNFHSNYNVYNGKFYAKISKSPNSTKAEAIPVLPIQGNKYQVIDIYKLKKKYKAFPDQSILSLLDESKTSKETIIGELGNKVLTSYRQ